eukprot:1394139-Alexandrium_andersonii.AAC.1
MCARGLRTAKMRRVCCINFSHWPGVSLGAQVVRCSREEDSQREVRVRPCDGSLWFVSVA